MDPFNPYTLPSHPSDVSQSPVRRAGDWARRHPWLAGPLALILAVCVCCSGVAALAAAFNAGGSTSGSVGQQRTATHASATAPKATATRRPPTATPKPAGPIFTAQGSGSTKTRTFSASGDWSIAWTCDPASFGDVGQYNLIVSVNAPDGTPVDPAGINVICKPGTTSGETVEHNQSGAFYLDVISEGAWTLTVTAA